MNVYIYFFAYFLTYSFFSYAKRYPNNIITVFHQNIACTAPVAGAAGGPEFALGGTVVVVMVVLLVVVVLGLWQVEAGDGVLLAVGLAGAGAAEVVEAGVDRF